MNRHIQTQVCTMPIGQSCDYGFCKVWEESCRSID